VAMGIVAKQPSDGYHLATCTTTSLIWVGQFRPLPYKYEDFVPVMDFMAGESGVAVMADSPWKTLKELVDYAKKSSRKLKYSSTGANTPSHLAMEYVAKREGIQWTMIPFAGSAPALNALLGKHVDFYSGPAVWLEHVKAGTVKVLATQGRKRMKSSPEVPTFQELGYDYLNETTYTIVAPKGIPLPIVRKLDSAFRKASEDKEFIETMEKLDIPGPYRSFEDSKRFLEGYKETLIKMAQDLKDVIEANKEPEKK
jgi:tripartite-type tricarboxylate transporter receptor subunit TctC